LAGAQRQNVKRAKNCANDKMAVRTLHTRTAEGKWARSNVRCRQSTDQTT
jgi:hypothetical protein